MKKYKMSLREKLCVIFLGIGLAGIIAYLFYHSVWGMLTLPVVYMLVKKKWVKKKKSEQKQQVREHFMHSLQILNESLQAGFSMENAWREVEKEILVLHKDSSVFYQEICQMNRSVTFNMPLEHLFAKMAYGFEIEEMINFAQIMEYGKKSGGNWKLLIEDTVLRMLERYEAQQEIEVIIAAKKLEQQVMNIVPLGMLLFLQHSAGDYMQVLYKSLLGNFIMTICLGLYVVALLLSEKIMDIQV